MIHHIHKSQIRSYLQGQGLSEIIIDQDLFLVMHSNTVEWSYQQLCYRMSFNPIESSFEISISDQGGSGDGVSEGGSGRGHTPTRT